MLEGLIGNATAEKVLLYIANYGEGHVSGIARTFGLPKSQVHKQVLKLERENILVAKLAGNTKMFQFNPRYSFKKELLALLQKALELQDPKNIEKYYRQRRRPRKTGKPL